MLYTDLLTDQFLIRQLRVLDGSPGIEQFPTASSAASGMYSVQWTVKILVRPLMISYPILVSLLPHIELTLYCTEHSPTNCSVHDRAINDKSYTVPCTVQYIILPLTVSHMLFSLTVQSVILPWIACHTMLCINTVQSMILPWTVRHVLFFVWFSPWFYRKM
jgi:hypothetical protein